MATDTELGFHRRKGHWQFSLQCYVQWLHLTCHRRTHGVFELPLSISFVFADYDALAMQSLDAPRRDSVVRSHSAMRLGDFAELVEQEKSAREQEEEEDDFDLFCKQAGRRKLSSCADWGGSLPDIPKATSPSYSLAKTLLKKRLHAPLTRGSTTPTRSKSMRSHSHKSSSMHGKLPGNVRNFIDKYDKALDGGKDCHSVPNSRSGSMRRLRYQKYHDNNSSGSAGGGSGSRPDSLVLPDDIPDDHYLVRQFVTTRKGVVNRGDSIRSCSTSSVRSAGSAAGNGNGAGSDTNDSDASPPAAAPSPLTLTPVKDRFKVLILGPRGVGKTTLIKQFQSTECSADADPVFEGKLSFSCTKQVSGLFHIGGIQVGISVTSTWTRLRQTLNQEIVREV